MRKYKLIVFIFIFVMSVRAWATTLYFLDTNSKLGTTSYDGNGIGGCVNGVNDMVYRQASTSRGSGTVNYGFQPTSTSPPCIFQTQNSGQFLRWASPPLSSAVTVSGNIGFSIGCAESSNKANAQIAFTVYRWTPNGGLVSVLIASGQTSECGASAALKTISAAAPTSTAFKIGDRIIIQAEIQSTLGWGGNGSRTITIYFGGSSGSTGDGFINFADTLSFSGDSSPQTSQAH